MKKVILMAAASLAIFATSFAQSTTPAQAPAMAKKSRVKPVGDAPAMQGTPAQATKEAPAGEKSRGNGEARGEGKGRGEGQGGLKILGLSPDQETKFKAINEGHKAAMKTVQADPSLTTDGKKAQMDLLKSKYEADVQGLLTTDQFTKWKSMRDKRGPEGGPRGERKGDGHGDGHGEMKDAPVPANGGAAPAAAPAPKSTKMKDKKSTKNN